MTPPWPPHHDGTRYHNLEPSRMLAGGGYWTMLREQFGGREVRRPETPLPIVRPSFGALVPEALRLTWLGHSTTLLEFGGARFLTDPVWAKRPSPIPGVGPARYHPPPLPLDALPPLDAVVLSHDHYDHLDKGAVTAIARLQRDVRFLAPLGVGAHLRRWGISADRIEERDWGGAVTVGACVLTAVPTRHFSGRTPFDRDATLWAAWVVQAGGRAVYLGGDSGPSRAAAEIGAAYGPFALATLPVGQYHRLWPDIHETPEQAAEAARALRAEVVVPIHWGTFTLAMHDWREPVERFLAAAPAPRVLTPPPGGTIEPAGPAPEAWWR